jgi:pyruvate/oxaloacetate carboxyltransferase
VTLTSQIVGTQAVLNVLTGERYKTIAKETAGILKANTAAPVRDQRRTAGESPDGHRPSPAVRRTC